MTEMTKRESHSKVFMPLVKEYEQRGYRCIPVHSRTPDFIAVKGGKVIAVEVWIPRHRKQRLRMKKKYKNDHRFDEIHLVEAKYDEGRISYNVVK